MSQVIAYMQPDLGTVAIVVPSQEGLEKLGIQEIARKDVPAGFPYRIIDTSTFPTDPTFRNAWEIDMSSPDGVGIGADAWFAEQAAKEQK